MDLLDEILANQDKLFEAAQRENDYYQEEFTDDTCYLCNTRWTVPEICAVCEKCPDCCECSK